MSHPRAWFDRLSVVVALGLVVVAPACGGVTPLANDGGGAGAGGGADAGLDGPLEAAPLTTDEGCDQEAKALCDSLNGCAPIALQVYYGDEATCIARASLSCKTDQSVGGITRTADDLSSCARALATASCADLLADNYPAACQMNPGTVVNGAACGSDWQCGSSFCNKTTMCGVCSPRAAVGGDCTADDGCAQELVCANKKCAKPAGPGEDCNLPGQPCRSDLYCPTSNGSAKCAAKVGAGGACADSDQACDLVKGVFCNPIDHTCETLSVAKGGDACGLAMKTICVGFIAPCSNFLTSGVCANPAQDGEACGMGGKVCVPPATCDPNMNVCRLPSAPDCH
jgi:hypothetical protein